VKWAPVVLFVATAPILLACSKIPPGRSAVDSVQVLNTRELGAGELENGLATQASPRFLFLFQGVAYDYEVYDEAVLQRDMARIERIYKANGFFDAHARVAQVRQVQSNHVRVEIVVDEGPATVNRNATIVGLDELPPPIAAAARTATTVCVVRGARFDEDAFKKAETELKKSLTDNGYAYASVESQAEVDVGQHTADYGFKVVPGPRSVFGRITFVGLEVRGPHVPGERQLPEGPLRRAIDIKEGSPYSTAEIDSATQALLDLGVFSSVKIVPTLPEPPPPDHVVPLTVEVEPTRLHQLTLGGGIELDEIKADLHLVGGWEDHNFLGGLRDLAVTVKPGVVLYPLRINNWNGPIKPLLEEWSKLELKQPGFVEARTNGFIRPQFNIFPLLVEVNPPPDARVVGYREIKLPVGVDRTFFKKLYVALSYTFQVEDPFAYIMGADPGLETVFLSYPELVFHLDFRDSAVRPHVGFYVGNSFQVAGGVFGGTATDVRLQPEVRTYLPIARKLTFATRASVGFLWSTNYAKNWNSELENSGTTATFGAGSTAAQLASKAQLDHDMQIMYFRGFFSGGPTTNRGFPILGVSPHGVVPFLNPSTASQQAQFNCDPDTPTFNSSQCFLPAGGFTLWELQNEVRADVSGPLSVTGFCDMSDVSPNENDLRLSHLHLTCGVGAAYDTPAGPIRIDLGYRVQPLQVLGFPSEKAAANSDPVNGLQPTILGLPVALAVGIGQAF
jgi:outer membrane protein assembly factor BamA